MCRDAAGPGRGCYYAFCGEAEALGEWPFNALLRPERSPLSDRQAGAEMYTDKQRSGTEHC